MRRRLFPRLPALVAVAAMAALLHPPLARAIGHAQITIINLDDPGEGFNDPTPADPVGGNPGTTVGEQRLFVFQHAASIWSSWLYSDVEILVEANFDPLDCDATSGVLGSAGPTTIHANFPNAPFADTWYHQALANRLAGEDLDPTEPDITTTFNSDIGQPDCLPQGWYYGVDGNEGAAIELLPVVLHELAHGLGFSTSTLAGVQEVFPHVYDHFLWDDTQGMHWNEMTDGQRAASSQNCRKLAWDGGHVLPNVPARLGAKPVLRVTAPAVIAGDYDVGLPSFGPPLDETGVSGDVVLVLDSQGVPGNGCETPYLNALDIPGKIAFIDRGGCTFVTKVKNAQDAGAIAVIVADSVPGCPALGMGGADPAITIPSVRITNSNGATLKSQILSSTVHATMRLDPGLKAGTDPDGRLLVYSPLPYALGSSVSHWDTSAEPSLLMEPALNSSLSSDVDLTIYQFADIGWFQGLVSVDKVPKPGPRLLSSHPNPSLGPTAIRYTVPRAGRVDLGVYDLSGRLIARLAEGPKGEGQHVATWAGTDRSGRRVAPGVYRIRLETTGFEETEPVVILR